MQFKGRCIIGVALTEAPSIRQLAGTHVARTGHLGVQKIHAAKGRYAHRALDAKIEDGLLKVVQGNVTTALDAATSAKLLVSGSGDIDAYVSNSVKVRVAGSDDILTRGNPPIRDHSVAGSGDIKFKK